LLSPFSNRIACFSSRVPLEQIRLRARTVRDKQCATKNPARSPARASCATLDRAYFIGDSRYVVNVFDKTTTSAPAIATNPT
jgi:hypothetical protein